MLCPFCAHSPENTWAVSDDAIALRPAAPIVTGHITVAPRRHVGSFYDLDVQEQRAVWNLVGSVKAEIARSLGIATFRVGFADAERGTDGHAVVHVVPNASGEFLQLPESIEWVADGLD